MACNTHADATLVEVDMKTGKKKRKKKYKAIDYVSFVKKKAMAKYPWDACIKDMTEEYGNRETAAKVCAAIKNRTVNR